jgi:hypothetical protein
LNSTCARSSLFALRSSHVLTLSLALRSTRFARSPGWDPLKLLNEKNAFIQDNIFQLQRNSAEKAARVNTLMTDALAMGADSIATIVGRGGDMQVVQNDMVRSFLDALVLQAQGKMGQLQQFFLDLMDRKERKVVQALDKIY